MVEKDVSYKNILSLVKDAITELDNAGQSISDAEGEISNAQEALNNVNEYIKIRRDARVTGESRRKSLALESVKHLRREAERIEENLSKES